MLELIRGWQEAKVRTLTTMHKEGVTPEVGWELLRQVEKRTRTLPEDVLAEALMVLVDRPPVPGWGRVAGAVAWALLSRGRDLLDDRSAQVVVRAVGVGPVGLGEDEAEVAETLVRDGYPGSVGELKEAAQLLTGGAP